MLPGKIKATAGANGAFRLYHHLFSVPARHKPAKHSLRFSAGIDIRMVKEVNPFLHAGVDQRAGFLFVLGLPEGHGNCHGVDEAESLYNLKAAVRIYVRALTKLDRWLAMRPAKRQAE